MSIVDCFDRRLTYLRVSVTDRCNLRCTYCVPEENRPFLPRREILSFEEISDLVGVAVRLGMTKIRLTGGEPLTRRDIATLVRMLAAIDGIADLAMTTNGVLLAELAGPLRAAGLHRLNVSLDSVAPERYREITRGGEVAQVLRGLAAAREAGFSRIKLNCVVHKSPLEEDAQGVARFGVEQGFEVRFIREMSTRDGRFSTVIGGDGGDCSRCSRLRVSSAGLVYPCLFSDRAFSLRTLGIEPALRAAAAAKPESGHRSANEFYALGG